MSKPLIPFLLLPLLAVTATCRSLVAPPTRPNVVVILIDTLRPDYLGFYGFEKETAPFLAQLAEESVVFERAFSTSSWTAPSTSSLFTSLYPNQHGVIEGFMLHQMRTRWLEKAGKETIQLNRLPLHVATLPEIFKSMGYATFGLVSNINIGDEMGFSRGFDQFEHNLEAPARVFLKRVQEWAGSIKRSNPFFLYLHFNDVHEPYRVRPPYYKKQKGHLKNRRARYLSEIGYTDEHIRKIYEVLSLDKDTLVVVLSDHGEEFRDHGALAHTAKLYIELNRILMMFHAPFLRLQPRHVASNVSLIDVLPTLVELAGGEPVNGAEGISLVPLLRNRDSTGALSTKLRRRTLFAHRIGWKWSGRPLWAATFRHWKLIEKRDSVIELYNHRADPTERRNLYSAHSNRRTSKLLAELQKFKSLELIEKPDTVDIEVDENLEKTLRSLGYVN